MEQDNSKVAWGKALKPIFALLLVIVLWQVLVLEMLKNGIISTLIAVVLVSAVSVVIFGIVFWVVKSLLNQFLTIAQGKTEDEQEQTKIGEKAKKLMEREDDIGLMMRSVHDSISSFATVISGIKTATEELKSVSDDFNNIFHDMEDSLKITQDSTHTIADNTVTQTAQTADMKEKTAHFGIHVTREDIIHSFDNAKGTNGSMQFLPPACRWSWLRSLWRHWFASRLVLLPWP